MKVTVEAQNTPDVWRLGGSTASLRISANQPFDTIDGQYIPKGRSASNDFYLEVDCTIVGNVLLIPAFEIDSTEDSPTNPAADYTATLVTSKRALIRPAFLSNFRVPATLPNVTWPLLRLHKAARIPLRITNTYNSEQIEALIAIALTFLRMGSATQIGMAALSVDPTDPAFPIGVAVNDPDYVAILAMLTDPRFAWIEQEVPFFAHNFIFTDQFSCFRIPITGDVTIFSIGSPPSGLPIVVVLEIIQDVVGGHAFAWPGNLVNPPTLNLAANAVTAFLAKYDPVGDQWFTIGAPAAGGGGGSIFVVGTAALIGGMVTVAAPEIVANAALQPVQLSGQDLNVNGALRVSSRTAGVGFDIASTDGLDSGSVGYSFPVI